MSYFDQIGDVMNRYLNNNSPINEQEADNYYDRIHQAVPSKLLGVLIGPALTSLTEDQQRTALYNSIIVMSPQQRADLLHQLFDSLAEAGTDEKKILTELGMDHAIMTNPSIVSAGEILRLFLYIQEISPAVFNHALAYYAEQPELVKALGSSVIAQIVKHLDDKNNRACAS